MKRKPTPRVYQCQIDESDEKTGVSLISFVSTPAIETDFIALSKQLEVRLAQDEAKQILTGPVLIPDQKIYRKDGKEEFYITFSADTIERIRNKFFQKGNTHATNLEHELALDGNYVVESWLISDAKKDKAVALGFEGLPVGTWMASYKVPDKEFWDEKVATGVVKGFSLEGLFSMEQIKTQLSKNDMSHKTGFLARAKAAALAFMSALSLSSMTLKDGGAIEVDDETKEVFNLNEEGERTTALADGSYELEDGTTITVKDGKLSEETAEEEKPKEEELASTVLTDGTYELPGGDVLKVADGAYAIEKADAPAEEEENLSAEPVGQTALAAQITEQEATIASLTEANTKLASEKAELVAKLAMKPAAEKVKLGGDKEPEVKLSKSQQRLAELRAQSKK
ncbi:XkdF-like putative serine protease domain-containing protein [Rufibacter soli]